MAGVISRAFKFALDRGAVGAHPWVGLKPFAGEKSRARTLTEDKLCKLWQALDAVVVSTTRQGCDDDVPSKYTTRMRMRCSEEMTGER